MDATASISRGEFDRTYSGVRSRCRVSFKDTMMSQNDEEDALFSALTMAAERDACFLTASAARKVRKRARADGDAGNGSTGVRVRSTERSAARSRKRRAVLDARTAATVAARLDATTATEAA